MQIAGSNFKIRKEINDEKLFLVDILLRSIGLSRKDFKVGRTCVCLRPLKMFNQFDILEPTLDSIQKVRSRHEQKLAALHRWGSLMKSVLLSNSKHSVCLEKIDETSKSVETEDSNKSVKPVRISNRKRKRIEMTKSGGISKGKKKRNNEMTESTIIQKISEKRPETEQRYDKTEHYPGAETNAQIRCKLEGCHLKTNNYCIKCSVHLCIKPNNNCFLKFHTKKSSE